MKFDHYEQSGVDEIFIVDPDGPSFRIFVCGSDGYVESDHSMLLDISVDTILDQLRDSN